MTNKYREAKHALWAASEEIYDYAYDYYSLPPAWHDADISITSEPLPIDKSDADRLLMVTAAAPQIAWLFGRLRDAFARLGDGGLKKHHYLRLTGVARAHELTAKGDYKVNGILRAVMNEAFVILAEMEEAEFTASRSPRVTGLESVAITQATNRWQEVLAG